MRLDKVLVVLLALMLGAGALALLAGSTACDSGGGSGAAWDENDIYIVVSAYIDGNRTSYFTAWGWDSANNFDEDVPSGDQRAFLYLKEPGQVLVCARPHYLDVPKQCQNVMAELGVPVTVDFYFVTPSSSR